MKLATLRHDQSTVAARLDADAYTVIDGFADVGALLASKKWRDIAANANGPSQPVTTAELAPVVTRPGKIVCAGMNYRAHILEMGRNPPEHPTLFSKFADTLIGAFDDIELPTEDTSIDWEAELAVVVGKSGRRILETEAGEHIAGYTVCNDVSMRDWQFRTGEWLQGKNWQNSTPLGPVMVTPDEWSPGGMIRTVVDGEVLQEASTDDLVHGPKFLISYISTFVELHPGDVIITGTPGGVGHARKPKRYLEDGHVVEVSIEGIGSLRNRATLSAADRILA